MPSSRYSRVEQIFPDAKFILQFSNMTADAEVLFVTWAGNPDVQPSVDTSLVEIIATPAVPIFPLLLKFNARITNTKPASALHLFRYNA